MSAPGSGPPVGMDRAEAERVAAQVAALLPGPLVPVFDPQFTRSHALYDEFIYRLTVQVFASARLAEAAREWGEPAEVVARAGLDPRQAVVAVRWMLDHLASRGAVARAAGGGPPRYRAERELPVVDSAAVMAEQRAHQPACVPSYTLAETAAREYPAFLRGARSGEEILLAPGRLPLWTGYFSNDNPLYAVNNRVGAVALEAWMRPGTGSILELGGGLASGAAAALERLASAGRLAELGSYRFTELVPVFLRRGQRLLQERFPGAPLAFAPLDMNRSFAEQGVAPGTVSIVYAVNTLHVAHDLAFTLGEVHRALERGGQLVISECIRPWPGCTTYPEFVFNLLETFRAPRLHPDYRPNGGFLTPAQWAGALAASGFRDTRILPDIPRIREIFPTFYVAALGATRPR